MQDIFLWWFEVEDTLQSPVEDGRIIWNIEYENSDTPDMSTSRIVSHIAIGTDEEPVKVMPVLKVSMNIALSPETWEGHKAVET